jgi:hypothetical protein
VGSRRALAKAIRTPGNGHRYTALDDRLQRGGIRLDAAAQRRRGPGPAGPTPS